MRAWLAALVAVATSVSPAAAGGDRDYGSFYQAKLKSISCEAFERAEARLRFVSGNPGMPERQFLEAMEMEVLLLKRRVYDARLDGYLPRASREANAAAPPRTRYLVFGFVEHGVEVVVARVELVDHAVCAIAWL